LEELQGYSKKLKKAVLIDSCQEATKEVCREIFRWGGIIGGEIRDKLFSDENHPDLVDYFKAVSRKLDPNLCDTDNLFWDIRINSGLVKIYSLLIDEFVMYDSRISAGLCYLVRLFCEDEMLRKKFSSLENKIPPSLHFSWGDDRMGGKLPKHNPDKAPYKFLKFDNADNKRDRVRHTIQASWLLKDVLKEKPKSKFCTEESPKKDPVRALADALFMIGQ